MEVRYIMMEGGREEGKEGGGRVGGYLTMPVEFISSRVDKRRTQLEDKVIYFLAYIKRS